MNFRDGIKGCAITTALLIILILSVSIVSSLVLKRVWGVDPNLELVIEITKYFAILVLLIPLSFLYHLYAKGSRRRFVIRTVSSFVFVISLLLLGDSVSYTVDNLSSDVVGIGPVEIDLDVSAIRIVMLAIPLLEFIHSFLEYKLTDIPSEREGQC